MFFGGFCIFEEAAINFVFSRFSNIPAPYLHTKSGVILVKSRRFSYICLHYFLFSGCFLLPAYLRRAGIGNPALLQLF